MEEVNGLDPVISSSSVIPNVQCYDGSVIDMCTAPSVEVPRLRDLTLLTLSKANVCIDESDDIIPINVDVEPETRDNGLDNDENKGLDENGNSVEYRIEVNNIDEGAQMDIDKLHQVPAHDQEVLDLNSNNAADSSFGAENLLENMMNFQQQYLFNALNSPSLPICTQTMVSRVDDVQPINSHQGEIEQYANNAPTFIDIGMQETNTQQCISTNIANIQSLPRRAISVGDKVLSSEEQSPVQYFQTPLPQHQATSTPLSAFRVIKPSAHYIYTPHPKTGQLLYVSGGDGASPQLFHRMDTTSTTTPHRNETSGAQFVTPKQHINVTSSTLNSSGEDVACSPDGPSENSSATQESSCETSADDKLANLLIPSFEIPGYGEETKELHNMKERRRRARIKDACDVMRKLVPGMSDKTDKATVFEFAARYIHFLKGFTGNMHDKDFLLKYSPY